MDNDRESLLRELHEAVGKRADEMHVALERVTGITSPPSKWWYNADKMAEHHIELWKECVDPQMHPYMDRLVEAAKLYVFLRDKGPMAATLYKLGMDEAALPDG